MSDTERREDTTKAQVPHERRLLRRVPAVSIAPVQLTIEALGVSAPATARDISIMGIGLLTLFPLEPDTAVTIRRGKSSSPLTAHVRQAIRLPDGNWVLCCCFSRPLKTDDMLALGA
jgi:hypothetical protein